MEKKFSVFEPFITLEIIKVTRPHKSPFIGRTIRGFTYQQAGQIGLGISIDVIKNNATIK